MDCVGADLIRLYVILPPHPVQRPRRRKQLSQKFTRLPLKGTKRFLPDTPTTMDLLHNKSTVTSYLKLLRSESFRVLDRGDQGEVLSDVVRPPADVAAENVHRRVRVKMDDNGEPGMPRVRRPRSTVDVGHRPHQGSPSGQMTRMGLRERRA